jgi:hypothetical protein
MSSSSTAPEGPGSVSGAGDGLPGGLREGYAEVGGQRLHYVEAGEGPLIVLLHGFPEFWYAWREQIGPLAAAGFRVVAPDTRGYNLSSKPDGVAAYDIALLAADIRDLIRERGAGTAMLAGHDWGGSCPPSYDSGVLRPLDPSRHRVRWSDDGAECGAAAECPKRGEP